MAPAAELNALKPSAHEFIDSDNAEDPTAHLGDP